MLRLLITFGIVLLAGGTQVTGGHQEANPYDDVLWQKVASIDLGELKLRCHTTV